MAATYLYQPGCYSADMMPSPDTRKRLLKADAFHDLTDRGRLRTILQVSWAERLGVHVTTDEEVESVKDFFYDIINRYHADINICDLMNPTGQEIKDEDQIITAFYGATTIPANPANPNDINNIYPPLTDHKVVRFTNESGLRAWLDYMKTTLFPNKRYVLDHTAISEGTLCDVIPNINSAAPILDTIGKAYDRSTILPPTTSCKEKIEYEPSPILTKTYGELLFFDTINIVDTNQLSWGWNRGSGTINIGYINIGYMNDVDHNTTPQNLSAFVIALAVEVLKAKASGQNIEPLLFDADFTRVVHQYIATAYGFTQAIAGNLDNYALGLMEFKRMGDLLQVRLAKYHEAVFVSNDRVAVLMAAIGYKIPALRTYVKREGDTYNYEMSVYNIPQDGNARAAAAAKAAEVAAAKATAMQEFYTRICTARDSATSTIFAKQENIVEFLSMRNSLYTYVSSSNLIINIQATDMYYLDMKHLLSRAIYIIFSYLLTLHGIINDHICSKQPNIISDIFIYTNDNTIIQYSIQNLYKLLKDIYTNLSKATNNGQLKDELIRIKNFINKEQFSLFGDTLKSYITIVNKVLAVKEAGRGRHIPTAVESAQGTGIIVGNVKGGKNLIDRLTYFESYIQNLCTRYSNHICGSRSGGSRNRKVNNIKRNMKGGFKPLSPIKNSPTDLIDFLLGNIILRMNRLSTPPANIKELFIRYLEIQLITQQFNMSFLVMKDFDDKGPINTPVPDGVPSPTAAISTQAAQVQIASVEKKAEPWPEDSEMSEYTHHNDTGDMNDTGTSRWPGGNKTSKKSKLKKKDEVKKEVKEQPIKRGKSKKKDEVKKEAKEQTIKGGKSKKKDEVKKEVKAKEQPVKGGKSKKKDEVKKEVKEQPIKGGKSKKDEVKKEVKAKKSTTDKKKSK